MRKRNELPQIENTKFTQRTSEFCTRVLGRNISEVDEPLIYHYKYNLSLIRIAATAIIVAYTFWMSMDILKGGSIYNLTASYSVIGMIAAVLFSIYMLLLSGFAKPESDMKLIRLSFFFYYVVLTSAVCIIDVAKNIMAVKAGAASEFMEISVATYMFLLLAFIPLPEKRDSMILGAVMFVFTFIPLLLPGREAYQIVQQLIVRVCIGLGYFVFWRVFHQLSETQYAEKVGSRQHMLDSMSDALTGTLNRRALNMYWETICRKQNGRDVGVIIFDIDNFKSYNDFYTNIKGDEILRKIGDTLIDTLGRGHYAFRYGGEEFVILLPNTTRQAVLTRTNEIKSAIMNAKMAREDRGKPELVTITIGCAVEKANSLEQDFIFEADKQLYYGKENGKDCYVMDGKIFR